MTPAPTLLQELAHLGKLNPNDLERVIAEQRRTRLPVEALLVDLGLIAERDLVELRARKLRVPFCGVEELSPEPSVVVLIPETLAMDRVVIALEKTDTTLTIAVADPNNVTTLDEIRRHTRLRLNVVMAARGEIVKKLSEYRDHYKAAAVEALLASVQDQGIALTRKMGLAVGDLSDIAEQSTVVKAVNLLLLHALVKRASDIHIVPGNRSLQVKYRVDGELVPGQTLPISIAPNVVSRIKILARLDISERRLPQDGSFRITVESREIDLRVATTPTIHGEKVVMRILDKQGLLLGLENLGFSRENYLKIRRNIRRPNGIILMVGPTGSGKTTTLYSALNAINSETMNITTVEDPVEYQIDGITQIQVHNDIGLSFANVLRSILRQDPDVVLVGEIRDLETTEIAIRASLTGHLVFATLHTNDAVSAITRLLDMGVEPYLIASALRCVVSQRLVRTICAKCKAPMQTDAELLAMLPAWLRDAGPQQSWHGRGCIHCFHTGYRGRTVIAEVLEVTEAIRRKVAERASSQDISRVAVDEGMRLLFQDGMARVMEGVSTLEEVLSVCDDLTA
jgi:type II secretory ATPase GspE/PulE/Tfp pilus assembly ATPase PilB-like protein